MIKGVGVDIVDVSRVKKILQEKHGKRFIERTFTDNEKKYCHKFKDPFPRFAGRFAVKEAFIKAISSVADGFSFKDIETINAQSGAPSISVLSGHFDKDRFDIHVSISHTDKMATAFVVIDEKKER